MEIAGILATSNVAVA